VIVRLPDEPKLPLDIGRYSHKPALRVVNARIKADQDAGKVTGHASKLQDDRN
jgi:hypothetical protein